MKSHHTQLLDASENSAVTQAAQIILSGGLVALPTETVYGLGALGLHDKAVRKIFAAKSRPVHNPLILHVADLASAGALMDFEACANPRLAQSLFARFAEQFWPGPLTLVCAKNPIVSDVVTAGLPKVAVRVPSHPVMQQVLNKVKAPIAAPSANASSRPSATSAQHVLATLDGQIDAVLDAGPCVHGLESSVVDISGDVPVLLRAGAISLETLALIAPNIMATEIGRATHHSAGSPGMVSKHYSPQIACVELVEADGIESAWNSPCAMLVRQSTKQRLEQAYGPRQSTTEALSDDATVYARNLYASLYRLEASESNTLLIETPPHGDLWRSIHDRLLRASGKLD